MRKLVIILMVSVLFILTICSVATAAKTERISISTAGTQSNADSLLPSACSNGRYVAFASEASNLVTDDTNDYRDIFVRDRTTGVTELVSRGIDGNSAHGASSSPSISANGQFVAYWSNADNLVTGGTNMPNIYVYDRQAKTTEQISIGMNGAQPNSISIFPSISADGRMVAFYSQAFNLVPGDNNFLGDVFVRDRLIKTTIRVSVSSNGVESDGNCGYPAISGNGRYIAFNSEASNLVSGDSNGIADLFVHDIISHNTELVTQGLAGVPANGISIYTPAISENGRFIAFDSTASNLVEKDNNNGSDVFVRDLVSKTTTLVSISYDGLEAAGGAMQSITADGKLIAFASVSSNIIAVDENGVSDIFVRDMNTQSTKRVSVGPGGIEASGGLSGGNSYNPAISSDGSSVTFSSEATNLVVNDTNNVDDIFLYQNSADLITIPGIQNGNNNQQETEENDEFLPTPSNGSNPMVRASSQSRTAVAMQTTGMPLGILLLSVLIVIGGFLVPRK